MSYNKTIWTNGVTPNSETNMNKIENELEYLDGKVEETGWIRLTPTLPAETAEWSPLQYRKKSGIVYINGTIYFNQTLNFGTVLATLPAGVRPGNEVDVCCRLLDSAAVAVIAVNTNGNIVYLNRTGEGMPENSGILISTSFISEN